MTRTGQAVRKRTCSVEDCGKPHAALGLCEAHYTRLRRYGNLDYRRRPTPEQDAKRFWSKVPHRPDGECWIYTGTILKGGYGQFKAQGQAWLAHRYAYVQTVGPIPDDLPLDHVRARGCTRRSCVNPAHLEPVTLLENSRRSDSPPARNARKTHCPRGHEYTPENTWVSRKRGWRRCRTCGNQARRKGELNRLGITAAYPKP